MNATEGEYLIGLEVLSDGDQDMAGFEKLVGVAKAAARHRSELTGSSMLCDGSHLRPWFPRFISNRSFPARRDLPASICHCSNTSGDYNSPGSPIARPSSMIFLPALKKRG